MMRKFFLYYLFRENIIKIFKLIEEVTNKSSVNDGVKKYIRSFLKEIKLILDVFTGEITGIHQVNIVDDPYYFLDY